MPFGWDKSADAVRHLQNTDDDHKASLTHEVIAGAAAFYAFKKFEDHQRAEHKVVKHAFAKEVLAGFCGAEVDRLFETKGLDFLDREKAKHMATENGHLMYDQHYIQKNNADSYDPDRFPRPDFRGLCRDL